MRNSKNKARKTARVTTICKDRINSIESNVKKTECLTILREDKTMDLVIYLPVFKL